jgi:curved DNA-binding protein CbpA
MNYYDELGVSPSASAEEIRQAYRELARLLHPDQHQEEGLRRAAERQMKRLNQVVGVLSDPVERRRYDLSLAGGPVVRLADVRVVAARAARVARDAWVWLVTAGVAVAALAYYFAGQAGAGKVSPAGGGRALSAARVSGTEAARGVAPEAQAGPRVARTQKRFTAETPETGKLRAQRDSLVLEWPPEVAVAPNALPARLADPPGLPAPQVPAAVSRGLAGTWLWAPPRVSGRQELVYPPEYIELRVIEEAGVLYGRYRARYRVADRALWPEVSFEFEGKPGQETFGWQGAGGARGEVRLKRLGAERLEVTWWASQLGERLSLASGTAVLVRER